MKCLIICICAVLAAGVTARADILLVPNQYSTIQGAIDAAEDGDMVVVSEGRYYEQINFRGKAITVGSYFLMTKDRRYIDNTVIDGSRQDRPHGGSVVSFVSGENAKAVLCGFTITGGSGTFIQLPGVAAQRGGGGILMLNSGGKILNNRIFANRLQGVNVSGAGIMVAPLPHQSATIENNEIYRNTAHVLDHDTHAAGGGIAVFAAGDVRIVKNRIYNNTVMSTGAGGTRGAGICCLGDSRRMNPTGIVLIKNNLIRNNTCRPDRPYVTNSGAGVDIERSRVQLINNQIIANRFVNQRGRGGGLHISDAAVDILNNFITGNRAVIGGGIYLHQNQTDNVRVINNTITRNVAALYGGGLVSNRSNSLMMNCILWDNSALNADQIQILGGILSVRYCDVQGGWSGEGNIDVDPMFVTANDYHLFYKSRCINAGIDTLVVFGNMHLCPPFDLEGQTRPHAGTVADIGADETNIVQKPSYRAPIVSGVAQLHQNNPNPFNPATTIRYHLAQDAEVMLTVYDLVGRQVRVLVNERQSAGEQAVRWDGRNMQGLEVASGIYVYRLASPGQVQTRKMMLLR